MHIRTIRGQITVSSNYEIDCTPAKYRRYPQRIELSTANYRNPTTDKQGIGDGFTIALEQISDRAKGEGCGEPPIDEIPPNPRALVRGTLYSLNGDFIELGGDGVVDVCDLEDFATGVLTLIENARRRGLFPRRPRSRADARGIEITAKGKAALAPARTAQRARGIGPRPHSASSVRCVGNPVCESNGKAGTQMTKPQGLSKRLRS